MPPPICEAFQCSPLRGHVWFRAYPSSISSGAASRRDATQRSRWASCLVAPATRRWRHRASQICRDVEAVVGDGDDIGGNAGDIAGVRPRLTVPSADRGVALWRRDLNDILFGGRQPHVCRAFPLHLSANKPPAMAVQRLPPAEANSMR